MTRRLAAALLCGASLACAQAPAAPPAPPSQEAATTRELTGRLSRKGPDETSFWAVTDASGKVFELVDVEPALVARFQKLQNATVTLRVEPRGRMLLEQVRVVAILAPPP